MPKIVKSIKGELVDFDILKIKQEMESTPTPIEVSERKQFIDNKLQRRIRRAKTDIENAKTKRNGLVDTSNVKTKEEVTTTKTVKQVKKINDKTT